MNMLQKLYLPVLNRIFGFTRKIDEKWRDVIIACCFLGFSLMAPLYISAPPSAARSALGAVLMLVITVLSIKEPPEKKKINPAMSVIWCIFTLSLAVAFFDPQSANTDLFMSLVLLPVLLPAFYMVWNCRRDYSRLFTLAALPYAAVGLIYSIAIIFIAPYKPNSAGSIRYEGTMTHPNFLGAYMMSVFVCCAYLVFSNKKWYAKLPFAVGCAFAAYYISLASSRTSMLIIIGLAFASVIYSLIKWNKRALAAALVVFVLVGGFTYAGYKHSANESARIDAEATAAAALAAQQAAQAAEEQVTSAADVREQESASASDVVSAADEPAAAPAPPPVTASSDFLSSRYSFLGKTLNSLLSARLEIWEKYIPHISLRGNNPQVPRYAYVGLWFVSSHAHNEFLETAFTSGLIAGAAELLLCLAALVFFAIWFFRKEKFSYYKLFCMLAVCAFFLVSLTECAGLPMNKGMAVLHYVALAPLFGIGYREDIEGCFGIEDFASELFAAVKSLWIRLFAKRK